MIAGRFIQGRRRQEPDGLRVLQFSPAPEAALPLTPFPGAQPDAEVELRALLMRLPRERQTSPVLLSVHALSGRLGLELSDRVGPEGEYRVSFTPRYDPGPRRLVLSGFRFAPFSFSVEAGEPAAGAAGLPPGPDLVLDLEVPRRVDPVMEPEGEGALVLQLTARLRQGREGKR